MDLQVEINVTYEESTSMRPVVETLMYPSRTIMDMVCLPGHISRTALMLYAESRARAFLRFSWERHRSNVRRNYTPVPQSSPSRSQRFRSRRTARRILPTQDSIPDFRMGRSC